MSVNYLLLFLLLFSSCSLLEPPKGIKAEEQFDRKRDKVVYSALKKFIKSMEAKGYYAAGIGEGLDHNTEKQNYLGVTFAADSLPNVEFARKIEVEALQEFQKYINAEEGVQDYVAEYPYPIKMIYIAFVSQHPEKGLFSVANCEEVIHYRQDNPEMPIGPSIEVHSETYEDAVQILKQQQGT